MITNGNAALAVPVAVVLAVVALAGCGGSSSGPAHTASPTTTPITATSKTTTSAAATRERFVAKLEDICQRSGTAAKTLESDFKADYKAHDYAKIAAALERLESLTASFRAEMAKLTPPADLEGAFARYKSATEGLRRITLSTIAALKARDPTALKTLRRLTPGARDMRTKAAIDLGATKCEAGT